MAYGDFKDLTTRTASDIILCYKAFNIAKNHKHDWYQRGLPSMFINVLINFCYACTIRDAMVRDLCYGK